MKSILSLSLALFFIALTGCTTTPVASAQKAGIKTMHIEPRVDAEQPMRYGADLRASGGGGLGYSLAVLMVDSANRDNIARMSGVMHANGIVLPDMIKASVAKYLKRYPELELKEDGGDGVLVIKILQYGFDTPALVTKEVPFLVLHVELLDRNGKRIWSKATSPIQWTSKGIGVKKWEDYEADPEKLRSDWNAQIDYVVSILFPVSK